MAASSETRSTTNTCTSRNHENVTVTWDALLVPTREQCPLCIALENVERIERHGQVTR